ncbi:hypothetical protein QBC37DRAFT_295171 [Rhypophila decipiens]|uniref:NAD(P)-binding protein n=1 Tax=Rhypophila decipiens TaxID=261697 RepID=A0AAN6XYP1_9PEZI|nr:hypothetical protein QBC37DRAFT_295171 [Rhypophila decipiens]
MTNTPSITFSNQQFAHEKHEGLVCVFMGATSGIGLATLGRLVTIVRSSTFYVLGRNPERYATELGDLRKMAPTCSIIFIEAQVALISSVDTACDHIKSSEGKVDIVCMSPGGMPFQGAVYTAEGLETSFAVSYYSRPRLVSNLLPLLCRSPSPRVLSILNGTKEKRIREDDVGLQNSWSIISLVNHSTLLTSLAFDHLAATAPGAREITFIHATPGFVNTGTARTRYPSRQKDGWLKWLLLTICQNVSGCIIVYFGMSIKEAGERQAYYLTCDQYTSGSWRTNKHNDLQPDSAALKDYKQRGWAEKAWEHTLVAWDRALATGGAVTRRDILLRQKLYFVLFVLANDLVHFLFSPVFPLQFLV